MTLLLESPWPAIFFGIVVEAILAVVLVRTGRGAALWAMIGTLLLTLGCVGLERIVETERERVEATLYGAAAAIEANDLNRLLDCISSSARTTRGRAQFVLGQFKFSEARLNDVQVEINKLTSPPTAKTKMIACFSLIETHSQISYPNGRLPMTVTLRREGDRWLITGHTEDLQDYLRDGKSK
jgi:hypothetical protein